MGFIKSAGEMMSPKQTKKAGDQAGKATVNKTRSSKDSRAGFVPKECEEIYRAVFEGHTDGLLIIDSLTYRFLAGNEAICRMLGYHQDEIPQLSVKDLHPKADLPFVQDQLDKLVRRDISISKNVPVQRKDKSVFFADITANPIVLDGTTYLIKCFRDVTEHKQAEVQIESLSRFPEENPFPVMRIDGDGTILYCNPSGRILLDQWNCEVGHPAPQEWRELISIALKSGRYQVHEIDCDHRIFSFAIAPVTSDGYVNLYGSDITATKLAEINQGLMTEVLKIFNSSQDIRTLIAETLKQIRETVGFDAVGLRLQEGKDYPYFEYNGFSKEFIEIENSLCVSNNLESEPVDQFGDVILECTCGLVLSDRTDPTMPFFTEGGSFWTNHSNEFLEIPADQDPRTAPRNRCIADGYQSIGLFPIRAGQDIIGLLQLNDRRCGQFTLERISFFETLAQNIGMALQRTSATEAIREIQEDLEEAQKVGNIGSWRLDVQTNELTWSNQNHLIFGIPKGTPLTYETFLSTIHPEDREYVDAQWQARLEGRPYDIEHRIIVDGQVKWVREKAYLEFNENGDLLGGFGITQDITDRKEAERALLESEQRLRLAAEAAHFGTYDADMVNMTLYWSPEMRSILGVSETEQAWEPGNLPDFIYSDDIEKVRQMYETSFDPRGNGQVHQEHRIVRPDGSLRWVLVKGQVEFKESDDKKVPIRSTGIVLDITELKEAETQLRKAKEDLEKRVRDRTEALASTVNTLQEEVYERINIQHALKESETKYRTLVESSPEAIGVIVDEKFVFINAAALKLLGANREDQVIGKSVWDFIHQDSLPLVRRAIRQILFIGTHLPAQEIRLIRMDGSFVEVESIGSPLLHEDRPAILVIAHDITERKRIEQELHAYQRELRSLTAELHLAEEQERRRIAQDLHDSIGQILSFSGRELKRLLKFCPDEAAISLQEVTDQLDAAVEQARTLSFDLSPSILYDLGFETAVEDLVERIADKQGLNYRFENCQGDKPLSDDVKVLLYRAVRELLINAAKHAQAANITVSLLRSAMDIFVMVEDDGRGFDPLILQSGQKEKRGFGLFSIRERLNHVGGHFKIESAIGQGTKAILTAPLDIEQEQEKT